jgi:hypothetical protein
LRFAQRSLSDWRADAASWHLRVYDRCGQHAPEVISKDTKQHTTSGFSRLHANFVQFANSSAACFAEGKGWAAHLF